MNKEIYQIKIVYTDAANKIERMPYRIVQFHKDTNLQQLAHHILKQFSFKLNEPFGFYSDPDNWHKSEHRFELFEEDPKKNTLKNTFIDDFFDFQKEYLFIYDYLEEHRFLLFFEKLVPERNGIEYPDLIESMGETKQDDDLKIGDDDDEPKFGIKKKTGGFKDEFDDYDDDDLEKLGSVEGDDDDDDFGDSGDDEFSADEFSDGGLDDDYK